MSETYVKAEIVRPKRPMAEQVGEIFASLFFLAFRVLIVWWFFAAWFPELGLTYWQLVLPVYAARCVVTSQKTLIGRQLTK